MEVSYSEYDYIKSVERITEILDSSDANYIEHNGIPSRTNLTYTNGYNVDITVLFVDIRGSKELSTKHTKPVLAKIYRAYISEVIAVIKGNSCISEIYIEGDGIWAVFNTVNNKQVDSVFRTAFCISSLVDILNIKLKKKKYSTIEVGIGIDDGNSLYIKAGYFGSGINEVVWIGKVVGEAANLCSYGNKTYSDKEIMVSERVYTMLDKENQDLLSWSTSRQCYHSYAVSVNMNKWVQENGNKERLLTYSN